MKLGPNEDTAMNVVANSGAEMTQEVIAADVIRAAEPIAERERLVKPNAFRSDSCGQVSLRFVAKFRRVEAVEIPE